MLTTRSDYQRLIVIVLALAAGCSHSTNTTTETNAPVDAGCDGAQCVAVDPCVADPHGAGCAYRAVAGAFHVFGVTSDNYALVTDSANNASMLDLAQGTLTPLATDYTSGTIASGNVVFVYHGGAVGSTHLPVVIWTAADGVRELDPSAASFNNPPSSDGTHVVWIGNVASDGSAGDMLLGSVDGQTPPTTLLAGVSLLQNCSFIGINGTIVGKRVIFDGCQNGVFESTLYSYDVDSAKLVGSTPSSRSYSLIDGINGHILVATDSGASVADLDLAVVTPIATDYWNGIFTPDGKSVFYADKESALWLVSVAGGAPQLVQAGPSTAPVAISPDGRLALYTNLSTDTALTDLYMTSLVPNAPAPLALRTTPDATILSNAFTADSKFALYVDNVDADYNGTLWAQPTAGGAGRMLANLDFYWQTLDGSRLLFTDVPVESTSPNGAADAVANIDYVDLSTGAAPTTLVQNANAYFYTTVDSKTLVYAIFDDPTRAGVYTMKLPQ